MQPTVSLKTTMANPEAIAESSYRQESDWRLFTKLIPYAQRSQKVFIVSMLLLLPLAISGAIQPVVIGQAISLIKQEEQTWGFLRNLPTQAGLQILVLVLLITIAIRLILEAVQGYLVQQVGQQMTADIREDLFNHVTILAMSFFDRTPVGKLITRITNDVEALGDVFSTGAIGIVGDILSVVVVAITMFLLQWQLALMLVAMLVPITALIIYFQQQYRLANYKARDELAALNSLLQENILGINVVQLFRRERFNAELFRSTNRRYIQEVDKTIFFDSAVSATLEWISLVAIAAVLWLGGALVLQSSISFGILSAFILYAQRLFDPLRRFAEKFTMLQSGFTAVERINHLLNEPITVRDTSKIGQHLPINQGEIKFEGVGFAYKPGEMVLHDLDFTIRPGEKVALVGPTGAGKSSIIRLLCRLYEPTYGRILIDGIDIRDIPQSQLRRHLGIILQDNFIFAGDVQSNISLGEDYSLEEVIAAAQAANVDQFIRQLPQGYHTQLRERGMNLSSGQKQLLAFARVAVRDPQILVLDEATASLDVNTEALVQDALDRLLAKRTAIIIAHRLSTIRSVDRILVIKRGRLIESGNHEELLQQNGLYASLHKLQKLGQ
jgi:ATP-binding cassette subfamily B protein